MRRLPAILTALLLLLPFPGSGQTIGRAPDDFHTQQPTGSPQPIPLPFIREADIVWSTELWKTIVSDELFNQFFFFPDDEFRTYGKKSLAYVLWDAVVADEIPIYEDDELLIPIDTRLLVERYTRADTLQLEIGYDDDDNELYETVIRPRHFDGAEVLRYALRETWFIGRQDTRQDSRRMAIAPVKFVYRDLPNGEEIPIGLFPIFWVPMQHPAVRALLARHSAYVDANNIVRQPSWDWVFLNQRYEAFATRESNTHNRAIGEYLTGEDAIFEASRIEGKIFDLESDMWEY